MSKTLTLGSEFLKPSSTQSPDKSQDFSPSATDKLATSASPKAKKAGVTPPKLPEGSKDRVFSVKEVYFSRMVRLPGYQGACSRVKVREKGEEDRLGTNQALVNSLVIVEGQSNRLIVDGVFFMPLESGSIDGWIH